MIKTYNSKETFNDILNYYNINIMYLASPLVKINSFKIMTEKNRKEKIFFLKKIIKLIKDHILIDFFFHFLYILQNLL